MLRRAADSRVVNETDEADESEPMFRVGLARLAWNGLKCMAWLVAVILALGMVHGPRTASRGYGNAGVSRRAGGWKQVSQSVS